MNCGERLSADDYLALEHDISRRAAAAVDFKRRRTNYADIGEKSMLNVSATGSFVTRPACTLTAVRICA